MAKGKEPQSQAQSQKRRTLKTKYVNGLFVNFMDNSY